MTTQTGVIGLSETSGGRRVAAACVGNVLEWYDFAVYGALASVLGQVFFPAHADNVGLLAVFAVYATAFVTRPVGAIAFGRLADVHDRQLVLAASFALMTLASAGVGLLPGYAVLGVLAPVLLVVLRGLQGLAAGGELSVSAVFLVEQAPAYQRGRFGGWHTATMSLGTFLALVVGVAITAGVPHDELADGWWRVAFLAALPLGLVGLYLRRGRTRQARPPAGPVRADHLWRDHRRALLIGFAQVSAGSLCFNLFFVFLPNRVATDRVLPLAPALGCAGAGLAAVAVAALLLGRLSDRVGRRPIVIPACAGLAMLAMPLLQWATSGSILALAAAELVAGVLVGGVLSVALLNELFPRAVRSRALAVTAGLASAIVGGTAPLFAQLAVIATGSLLLPGLYLSAVALVAAVAVATRAETAFEPFD